MSTCSIIIPVYNHAALTRLCLDRLLAHPPKKTDQEIIVVDDGSRDHTATLLAGYGARLRVVTHTVNQGFATTCNDGAAQASGEYLVFLNNDTLPTPGWLDHLVDYAESHPHVAVVGSRLLYANGTVQHAGVIIGQDRLPWHIYAGFPGEHPAVLKSRRFQIVTGACMLVRRDVFQAIGGFDTTYKNGWEDVDLCLRLGERGDAVHYCHQSLLYHLESPTRGHSHPHLQHNLQLYRERWASKVTPDDLAYYVADGLIRLSYTYPYPVDMTIDRQLAVVNKNEPAGLVERLLDTRARQFIELQRENSQLAARVAHLEEARTVSRPGVTVTPSLTALAPPTARLTPGERRPVSIVAPVYNGLAVLKEAVDSILKHTDLAFHTLVLIDDASPDAAVREYLWGLRQASTRNLLVVLNEKNLGFPGTTNRGMVLSDTDVILLNSDVLVTPRWVEKLQHAAYSRAGVASVTPFSNNATIYSIPQFNTSNPIPAGFTVDTFAELVEQTSLRRYPETPTAHGFCMYIRREAINAVGLFDVERFQRGYGEENDWCMRATQQGFCHLLDDATYIYHHGSVSFTTEGYSAVIHQHIQLLNQLYPGYDQKIADFIARNPLQPLHNHIATVLQSQKPMSAR